jgi:hypothetical protein
MKNLSLLSLQFLINLATFGQQIYPTRDSVHIFWQPGLIIKISDYKGDTVKEYMPFMRKYNILTCSSVGIWSVVDIPKKKSERGKKLEKAYFAPAFDRTNSFLIRPDSLEIEKENLIFDICEVWARWARKQLFAYQDSIKGYGAILIMYSTVEQNMNKDRKAMSNDYIKDVFIDKKEGSYEKWRASINDILENSKTWATKPEECFRLMTKKPIDDSYIKAYYILGPIQSSNK